MWVVGSVILQFLRVSGGKVRRSYMGRNCTTRNTVLHSTSQAATTLPQFTVILTDQENFTVLQVILSTRFEQQPTLQQSPIVIFTTSAWQICKLSYIAATASIAQKTAANKQWFGEAGRGRAGCNQAAILQI